MCWIMFHHGNRMCRIQNVTHSSWSFSMATCSYVHTPTALHKFLCFCPFGTWHCLKISWKHWLDPFNISFICTLEYTLVVEMMLISRSYSSGTYWLHKKDWQQKLIFTINQLGMGPSRIFPSSQTASDAWILFFLVWLTCLSKNKINTWKNHNKFHLIRLFKFLSLRMKHLHPCWHLNMQRMTYFLCSEIRILTNSL